MLLIIQMIHLILTVGLITLILIQSKGVGLSGTFGGGGEVYFARRGAERVVFYLTIFISFAFIATSVLHVWLS